MRVLLVSATILEIKHLIERFQIPVPVPGILQKFHFLHQQIDLLISGIGMLPTVYYLGKHLSGGHYNLAINAGICGAYHRDVPLGTVFRVTEETLPELGVDAEGEIHSVFETGLIPFDEFPFHSGKLINPSESTWQSVKMLPRARGNTIQTLQSSSTRIARLLKHSPAEVETMEGAAFLYCCLAAQLPCLQIRAVSNYVGEPDRRKWQVELAVKNLDGMLMEFLGEMD